MRCSDRFVLALTMGLLAALAAPARVQAQSVVTACGRDDAMGGLNLRDALATGGPVVLRCPAGQPAIELTATYTVTGLVSIDGESRALLFGTGARPFFEGQGRLELRNLTVRNDPSGAATGVATDTSTAIARGADLQVILVAVRTEATPTPYIVQGLEAADSVFEGNGLEAVHPFRGVVDANRVVLRRTTFQGNRAHPLVSGPPAAGPGVVPSRSLLIEDATFRANSGPILVHDSKVVIRRSTFEGNGVPPEAGQQAWGCCAGALVLVHADATISDTSFTGNNSFGFGGAVQAIGSRLTLTRVDLVENAARAGGALFFWGRPIREDIWGGDALPGPVSLRLDRTIFRANRAQTAGGALLWAGDVQGDAVLLEANVAGGRGGGVAHWRAAPLSVPFSRAFDGLIDQTEAAPDRLTLARGTIVGNQSGSQGAAVDGGTGEIALGNALIVRNAVTDADPIGGAIFGTRLSLANATVADNEAAGITLAGSSAALTLTNTILSRNARGNCHPQGGAIGLGAANLQDVDNGCSPALPVADPGLQPDYTLAWGNPARSMGETSVCAGDPLVRGIDLRSNARLAHGTCSLGAFEADLRRELIGNLPLATDDGQRHPWLFWLVLLLFLLGLFLGFHLRRRCKNA
ncbi:hypothetical protein [Microvirga sp. TS319]|uniref:hypothetical protein n=1 Tax=Microvirga sp. TS319 TaxID=3241165 RepID=UPI00351A0686